MLEFLFILLELRNAFYHGPLARYVKLRVAHATGIRRTFSPPPRVSDSDIPGSQTSCFLWNRWRGKRSRHSRRMRNPQIYVSDKGPMAIVIGVPSTCTYNFNCGIHFSVPLWNEYGYIRTTGKTDCGYEYQIGIVTPASWVYNVNRIRVSMKSFIDYNCILRSISKVRYNTSTHSEYDVIFPQSFAGTYQSALLHSVQQVAQLYRFQCCCRWSLDLWPLIGTVIDRGGNNKHDWCLTYSF